MHSLKRLTLVAASSALAMGLAVNLSTLELARAQAGDDVVASISVPASIEISLDATARDEFGHGFAVTAGEVLIGGPGDQITVPVYVQVGWTLESLTDPVTGITITRNSEGSLLRIPIRDAEGNDTVRVLVNSTDYIGDGQSATATIGSMSIDLPTSSRDFSEIAPEVGVASVKILGQITGYPGSSSMDMSIAKTPDAETLATIQSLAAQDEFEVVDVAYIVGLDKTNLDHVLGEMTLRLTVGKAWYDSYGKENIRVVRIGDDGSTQVFNWEPVDPAADPVQFNLVSPNGLSRFVIEALQKAQPTPTPTPTETPEPTSTPMSTPTLTPTVAPAATSPAAPPPAAQTQPSPTATLTPSPTTPPSAVSTSPGATPTLAPMNDEGGTPAGGNCGVSRGGPVAVGNIGLLTVAIGLVVSRRMRSR